MRYYSTQTLRGFDSYKYRALDTSPLSIYVMHPFWDRVVTLAPPWLAPNTLTFLGFILAASNFLITCYYDWYFYASSPTHPEVAPISKWVWLVMLVFHFGSHTLDGIDGKQAKRTKSSSPLGMWNMFEMIYFWLELVSKHAAERPLDYLENFSMVWMFVLKSNGTLINSFLVVFCLLNDQT